MRLFVSNISFSAGSEQVRDFFRERGHPAAEVTLCTDRGTGASRGFAFIEMETAAAGRQAIAALDGQEFMDRRLNVQEARERERRYR